MFDKNRCGVLFGINETKDTTKTITPTMWSLMNILPKKSVQKPHVHNSAALDFVLQTKSNVYTLIGKELSDDGTIKNPYKKYWQENELFITPPGMWHSHVNESDEDAWILPVQDAGLHTYMNTLNINFVN